MKPHPQSRRRADLSASSQPQRLRTPGRANRSGLLLLALFLALAPTALASNTWYVDGMHGNDNNNCKTQQTACKTVRHGISLASSGDSISVAAATYTENLAIGLSLKVIGSGARTTIVDGGLNGSVVTISNSSSRLTLSNLTIRNGYAHDGGGILNNGTLTISNSSISRNWVHGSEFLGNGGGISNYGTLTINESTVTRNNGNLGGGISNIGTATIKNTTISGNGAIVGGGIENFGPATINNTTITGNSALYGGAIRGTATLQNSIVANSPKGGNCGGSMASKGYNLSSDNTCNFNNSGDLNNTDPKLGQLGNYGGPTQTVPLLSGSPAIDAGNPSGCTDGFGHLLKTDQRGKPRPDKEDTGGCDMGAYERQTD